MTWKELKKLADDKALYLEDAPDSFMKKVFKAQELLFLSLSAYIDGFDTEDGNLINTSQNLKRINGIDQLFNDYQQSVLFSVVSDLINELNTTATKSIDYYKTMLQFSADLVDAPGITLDALKTAKAVGETSISAIGITEKKIISIINARLGITAEGNLIRQGYLYNVYNNTMALNYTRELMYKGVVTKMPVSEFKAAVKEDITGLVETLPNEEARVIKNGIIAKDFSIISNDVFAKIDRTASIIVKEDYHLRYFIYGGTIIKTTRPFCKPKVNKVFNTDDAKKWIDEVPGPIAVDKDTYDPVIDCGGINCRHTPLFISSELYEVLKAEGSDLIPS